jgi:transposase InsO family protein
MDLYSRKIVGWHADHTMTKELVLKALQQAYVRQRPEGPVLHHSDRGSQYASNDYQKQLQQYGMNCSMSRKGNCYDNACIESFHGVLKKSLFINNNTQHVLKHSKIFGNTLKFSIIVKESIQQMTIYRQHRKNVCTN